MNLERKELVAAGHVEREDARCALHPALAAVSVCARCGDFFCSDCASSKITGHCTACEAQALPRGSTLGRVAHVLFGFTGRISRTTFWLATAPSCVLAIVVPLLHGTALFLVCGLLIWTSAAVQVKRWHDHGKPGLWFFFPMVPGIGLWGLIELGCLRGNLGRNLYGDDPLGTTTVPGVDEVDRTTVDAAEDTWRRAVAYVLTGPAIIVALLFFRVAHSPRGGNELAAMAGDACGKIALVGLGAWYIARKGHRTWAIVGLCILGLFVSARFIAAL